MGIYKIINLINNKMYVGSAKNLDRRKETHFTLLGKGTHHNAHLQAAFNLYGRDAFQYEVIEHTGDLIEREQYWIDYYGFENLYNICPKAYSRLGCKTTEETKKKQSEASKKLGLKPPRPSAETYARISASHKANGIKPPCKWQMPKANQHRLAQSERMRGHDLYRGQSDKPCSLLSPEGHIMNFKSQADAARHIGCPKPVVSMLLTGKRESTRGWRGI